MFSTLFSKNLTTITIYVDPAERIKDALIRSNFHDENHQCMMNLITSFCIDDYSAKDQDLAAHFFIKDTGSINLDFKCVNQNAEMDSLTKEYMQKNLIDPLCLDGLIHERKDYVLMKCAAESLIQLLRNQGLVPIEENVRFAALESMILFRLGSAKSSAVCIPADGVVCSVCVNHQYVHDGRVLKSIVVNFNELDHLTYEKIKNLFAYQFEYKEDNRSALAHFA